jgi:hypothetical protein
MFENLLTDVDSQIDFAVAWRSGSVTPRRSHKHLDWLASSCTAFDILMSYNTTTLAYGT